MKILNRSILLLILMMGCWACKNRSNIAEPMVQFRRMNNYQLPQQVIGFFYDYDYRNPTKTLNDPEQKYQFRDSFLTLSHFTETHYSIEINHHKLNIRERDFMPPFLMFRGRLYFNKTRIQFGKLQTPQELMIYSAELDSLVGK